jgi:DNA-binding LacI/PurR family transcriptional regulator
MHHKNTRSNIKEVAAAAGVSTQTVSRVINQRPDVSPETRQRVLEVIKALDYQPSALARSLIRQRSSTLGVVTSGLNYIGPSRTLSGIAASAEAAGYSLLLKELPGFESRQVSPIIQYFLAHHVEGIIWAVPEVGDNHAWIAPPSPGLELPIVFLTTAARPDTSSVSIDNYIGARLVVEHLLQQGYRRIAHIAGPLAWWEAQQRKAAWHDACSQAGLATQETHWLEGNWSSASGAAAFERLLQQFPELDAVFAANDQMALGVIQVAHQQGLRIPEALGIAGFDDIPEAAFFCPPITTVQQDHYRLATLAVEEIIQIIEAGLGSDQAHRPQTITLPPSLIIRKSTSR